MHGAFTKPAVLDSLNHGQSRFARHRIAAKCAPQSARAGVIHNLRFTRDRAERKPAAEALGCDYQVRLDVFVLDGKHLPGAGEAGLHFVRDEDDAVLTADIRDRRTARGRYRSGMARSRLYKDASCW